MTAKIDAHGRHPPASRELGAHFEIDQLTRGDGEPVGHGLTGAHGLGEAYAAHGEAFVDLGQQVGELALLTGGHVPPQQGDPPGQPDRGWQHDQGEQGQSPAQGGHGDGGGGDRGDVGGDRRGGVGNHGLHGIDIVGEAGLDLAPLGAGEEGQRLALQVGEDVGTERVHDALPHQG